MKFKGFFLLSLLLTTPVHGESPFGRLEDGRAYRTDAEGNQIVDYIAELELEVSNLKRRVSGLEIEVEEKDKAIARVKSGGSLSASSLGEKDLLTGEVRTGTKKVRPVDFEDIGSAPRTSSDAELQKYKKLSEQCQEDKVKKNQQIATLRQENIKLMQTNSSKSEEFKSLQAGQSESEEELRSKIAVLEGQVQEVRSELGRKDEEIQSLDEKLQQAELKLKDAEKQKPPYARVVSNRSYSTPPSSSQNAALSSLKGSVKKDIVKIQRLIDERNKYFIAYRKKNGGKLSFNPKRAVSSSGKSLTHITALLGQARTTSDVTALHRDVKEIGNVIKNDLAFIKRMSKIS